MSESSLCHCGGVYVLGHVLFSHQAARCEALHSLMCGPRLEPRKWVVTTLFSSFFVSVDKISLFSFFSNNRLFVRKWKSESGLKSYLESHGQYCFFRLGRNYIGATNEFHFLARISCGIRKSEADFLTMSFITREPVLYLFSRGKTPKLLHCYGVEWFLVSRGFIESFSHLNCTIAHTIEPDRAPVPIVFHTPISDINMKNREYETHEAQLIVEGVATVQTGNTDNTVDMQQARFCST